MNRKVIIIGGGITGVAAFIGLIQHRSVTSVDIIDPRPVGLGKAFATVESALLCNTPVETMSIIPADRYDFLKYLRGRGFTVAADDCVPRFYVTQYARDRYQQYCVVAQKYGVSYQHVRHLATAIHKIKKGDYQVCLDDGSEFKANDVLVCYGYGDAVVPSILKEHINDALMFKSPYPEQIMLDKLPPKSRVLVMGTRLSAIDTALLLCAHGHEVVLTSPSGELPAVRTRAPTLSPSRIDEAAFSALDFTHPLLYRRLIRIISKATFGLNFRPLSQQLSRSTDTVTRLREEIKLATDGHTDWQDVLVNFLDLGNQVLTTKNRATRDSAVSNCRRMIARYLFAIPLCNAQALLRFINEKKLRLISGIPSRINRDLSWSVVWKENPSEMFDAVVCAAGFQKPRFHVEKNKLEFVTDPSRPCVDPVVSADLRVSLLNTNIRERIWLLGVSSYLGTPLVNAVYQAVQQVDAVRRQFKEELTA